MALSPNYGWSEPDNSSLVKNGAADIRTLGDAIDTSLWNVGFGQAGKNKIINGNFDIWQRGTTFTATNSGAYTADRWHMQNTNTVTISQQTTGVPVGSQYCLRMTSGSTLAVSDFFQYIETANVVPMQGKTVTYSIKLRRNAANTSNALLLIQKSATTDAGSGASWTTISSATVANASLPTGTTSSDWYTATLTLAIPSDGTANSLRVYASTSAQIANTAYLELAQAQLEVGSVATPFQRAGGTIQGELAACQRYYYRANADGTGYPAFGNGTASTGSQAYAFINFPVIMRTKPTALEQSGTASDYGCTNALYSTINCNTVPLYANASTRAATVSATVASGLVAGNVVTLYSNNTTNAYLAWSAEL